MPATVILNEWNGTGGTKTRKDTGGPNGNIRFKDADNAAADMNNPITVPAANSAYSFEKWLRLEVTGGTYTSMSNIKAYSDGTNSFGTGISVYYAVVAAYDTTNGPTKPSQTNGAPTGAQHPSGSGTMGNFFTTNSGAPIDMGAASTSGTGDKGSFLVLVMEVASTATQGTLAAETLTFSWDEV